MPQVEAVLFTFAVLFGGIYSLSSVLLDQNAKHLTGSSTGRVLKQLRQK